MAKGCELCGGVARMYCESDQASLCWDCDEKVHGANFLVAKHCRSLLCQVCQSPTAWKASGLKLSHTVSICESCVLVHDGKIGEVPREETEENDVVGDENGYDLVDEDEDGDGDSDGYSDSEDDDDDDGELDQDEEVEDEDDGDNQVVPWSCTAISSPLPPTASSSTIEDDISSRFSGGGGGLKRRRGISSDLDSDDEIGCSSSRLAHDDSCCERLSSEEERASSGGVRFRPLKQARTSEIKQLHRDDDYHFEDHVQEEPRTSTAIVDSIKKLQRGMVVNNEEDNNTTAAAATILEICRLSRDERS